VDDSAWVGPLVRVIALAALLFIPFRIIGQVFSPLTSIIWYRDNPAAYLPWVQKLRPEDRAALHW
jgi:hypothetical protein